MGTDKQGTYPKRSPIGVYDPRLLCHSCEARFSSWDDYAKRLLLARFQEACYFVINEERIAYKFDAVDYRKLKMFFVSLLWRASASNREFFASVSLGPFQELARQMILTNNPGEPENFAVILSRFEHPTAVVMLNPDSTKFDGVNFCRFYLASYVVLIKVDRRPLPRAFEGLQLAPDRRLLVLLRDFRSSKELPVLKKLAKAVARKSQTSQVRS